MAKIKIADDFHENESGVTGQYKNWFLDYASYVILERAVPAIEDGSPGSRTGRLIETDQPQLNPLDQK